jgi:hypothetical protein
MTYGHSLTIPKQKLWSYSRVPGTKRSVGEKEKKKL